MKANSDNNAKAEIGPDHPLGYTIPYLALNSPLSRSYIYTALNLGLLKAKKAGRRTIIPPSAWAEFIARLPDYPVAA